MLHCLAVHLSLVSGVLPLSLKWSWGTFSEPCGQGAVGKHCLQLFLDSCMKVPPPAPQSDVGYSMAQYPESIQCHIKMPTLENYSSVGIATHTAANLSWKSMGTVYECDWPYPEPLEPLTEGTSVRETCAAVLASFPFTSACRSSGLSLPSLPSTSPCSTSPDAPVLPGSTLPVCALPPVHERSLLSHAMLLPTLAAIFTLDGGWPQCGGLTTVGGAITQPFQNPAEACSGASPQVRGLPDPWRFSISPSPAEDLCGICYSKAKMKSFLQEDVQVGSGGGWLWDMFIVPSPVGKAIVFHQGFRQAKPVGQVLVMLFYCMLSGYRYK